MPGRALRLLLTAGLALGFAFVQAQTDTTPATPKVEVKQATATPAAPAEPAETTAPISPSGALLAAAVLGVGYVALRRARRH